MGVVETIAHVESTEHDIAELCRNSTDWHPNNKTKYTPKWQSFEPFVQLNTC